MNKTVEGRLARARALAEAKRVGDRFTVMMIEDDVVDFDPQPAAPPPVICAACRYPKEAMVGCYCDWGDGGDPPDGRGSP